MRRHILRGVSTAGVGIGLLMGAAAQAAIPEPNAIVYGTVTRGGAPSTTDTISVRLDGGGVLGAPAPVGAGGAYAVQVPLYFLLSGESRPAGSAKKDDTVELLVNGAPLQPAVKFAISERGALIPRNLALSPVGNPDVDGDGVANSADNCSGVANAGQADANGNGIGDACEGSPTWNPPLRVTLVGDASNPADTATGRGRVTAAYQIGTAEVTHGQYGEFLNAVARTADPGGLYDPLMGSDPRGGITRTGSAPSLQYKVKPSLANKPVNFVSWLDAARYVNWLHNGRPTGAQSNTTTEKGAYDLTVANAATLAVRQASAKYALATEDEWYKAAYYDAGASRYWAFPGRADTAPVLTAANDLGEVSNPGANRANHDSGAVWGGVTGRPTAVDGEGALSRSYYATANQGGSLEEWLGAPAESGLRIARGGSYLSAPVKLRKDADLPGPTERATLRRDPLQGYADVGFRIVGLGATLTADDDGDGVVNGVDNCVAEANGAAQGVNNQLDTDGDGLGNACDCDFNNDGICGQPDYTLFLRCFNKTVASDPTCAVFDLRADAQGTAIGQPDYTLFLKRFNKTPGPSGVRP